MIGLPFEMALVFVLTLVAGLLPASHFLIRYVVLDRDDYASDGR